MLTVIVAQLGDKVWAGLFNPMEVFHTPSTSTADKALAEQSLFWMNGEPFSSQGKKGTLLPLNLVSA